MDAPKLLEVCRRERGTEAGQAFLGLARQRLAEITTALLEAETPQVPRLQGAAQVLTELLRDVEADPAAQPRKDGAYA